MSYEEAGKKYAKLGIDTEAAIEKLKKVPVSLHCWQGDDVRGFDTDPSKPLTGGIQTTGNYPGRARNTGSFTSTKGSKCASSASAVIPSQGLSGQSSLRSRFTSHIPIRFFWYRLYPTPPSLE